MAKSYLSFHLSKIQFQKGSVFKTMKYLGFLPQETPPGEPKLFYWFKAGVGKVLGSPDSAKNYGNSK